MNKLITEQKDIIRVLFILVKILQFFVVVVDNFTFKQKRAELG